MIFRKALVAATALVAAISGSQAGSPTDQSEKQQQLLTPVELITQILTDGAASGDMFADSFLAAVPLHEVNDVLAETLKTMGAPIAVAPRGEKLEVTTKTHSMLVNLTLDAENRIAGVLLEPAVALDATLSDATAALLALEGDSSLLITRNGEPVEGHNVDGKLAVGSAFKLGVLAALNRQIVAGKHEWDDILVLDARHKSLPSGILQSFPDGAPVSLHTAASLMISQSDNTATDMVMELVGRADINAALGGFALTTREFFQLKADPVSSEAFVSAQDMDGKTEVVERFKARPLPAASDVMRPHDPGVEWYVPVTALCELIEAVEALDVVGINTGVADPAVWERIAFKGGSEIGVINLTTRLVNAAGDVFCVAYTLNRDTVIDERAVEAAYAGVIIQLAKGGG